MKILHFMSDYVYSSECKSKGLRQYMTRGGDYKRVWLSLLGPMIEEEPAFLHIPELP